MLRILRLSATLLVLLLVSLIPNLLELMEILNLHLMRYNKPPERTVMGLGMTGYLNQTIFGSAEDFPGAVDFPRYMNNHQ